jgi:hypothetical protein
MSRLYNYLNQKIKRYDPVEVVYPDERKYDAWFEGFTKDIAASELMDEDSGGDWVEYDEHIELMNKGKLYYWGREHKISRYTPKHDARDKRLPMEENPKGNYIAYDAHLSIMKKLNKLQNQKSRMSEHPR